MAILQYIEQKGKVFRVLELFFILNVYALNMEKDFDAWNKKKKATNASHEQTIFYEREVWWSKIGLNIGVEIDGKHEIFLRPVIILRKFNKDMAIIIPTTAQDKSNKYYLDIAENEGRSYKACLSQIQTISTKRLFRKIGTIRKEDYELLIKKVSKMIQGTL